MRRLVVVLLVATLSLIIAGCGGGGAETTPPPASTGTGVVTTPNLAGATQGITDRSALSTETFKPFVAEDMPADVQKLLDTKQAMLLFFYNPAQLQTDDLRSQINAVIKQNRGNIDLLTFDLSKYSSMDASGNVQVDTDALLADKKSVEAVRFAKDIGVDYVPYIVIVDDQGYEIFWSRGFIDAQLLERQVQRAVR